MFSMSAPTTESIYSVFPDVVGQTQVTEITFGTAQLGPLCESSYYEKLITATGSEALGSPGYGSNYLLIPVQTPLPIARGSDPWPDYHHIISTRTGHTLAGYMVAPLPPYGGKYALDVISGVPTKASTGQQYPPVKLRITANMVTKLCQAEFTLPTDLTSFSNMKPEEIEELKQTPEKRADTIKTLCQSMLYQHLLPLVDPARGTRGVDYELPNPFSGHHYELERLYNLRAKIMARFVLDCATDPTTRPT
jgi:hypothetical protein